MKFGHLLEKSQSPDLPGAYFSYNDFKMELKRISEDPSTLSPEEHGAFVEKVLADIRRVDERYVAEEASLVERAEATLASPPADDASAVDEISDLVSRCALLENLCYLNATAVRKLGKKNDKHLPGHRSLHRMLGAAMLTEMNCSTKVAGLRARLVEELRKRSAAAADSGGASSISSASSSGPTHVRIGVTGVSRKSSPMESVVEVAREFDADICDIELFKSCKELILNLIVRCDASHVTSIVRGISNRLPASNVNFDVIEEGPAVLYPTPAGHTQLALTMMSSSISATAIGGITRILRERRFQIENVRRLDVGDNLGCIEMVASTETVSDVALAALRRELLAEGRSYGVDVGVQRESALRGVKRLVVFDMDSTLIQHEVIDEIAALVGVKDQVSKITQEAMEGKLDFAESLARRVALLRGVKADTLEHLAADLHLTPGAKELCRVLKTLGYTLAVISGGFTTFTHHVKEALGLDYHFANTLEVDEETGLLTGRTTGHVVTSQRKADLLLVLAQQLGIRKEEVIAIGDGANDLPMLGLAGLGIAFNAKEKVREKATYHINQNNLLRLLFFLGIHEAEAEELIALSQVPEGVL